ncbi:MAG: GNAT family N-acetyltransferase [Roseibium sp.]|nr:GNAT family N-acetyltransferase [Roseibium sp.]
MSGAVIKTDRLVLRPPAVSDLERCAELLGDHEVAKMLARVPHPYDLAKGREFLRRSAANWAHWPAGDDVVFFVTRDNDLIGGVSVRALQDTPLIGYWLGRSHWGNGLMTEAVFAVVDWLFRVMNHQLIASEAMTDNPASLKVMQKTGFRTVGRTERDSASRGCKVAAIRTELRRADFLDSFKTA